MTGYGTAKIFNSTIFSNTSIPAGGSLTNVIGYATTKTFLKNSIIAGDSSGTSCGGATDQLTSLGYNLSDDSSCSPTVTTDLTNTNPMLGGLQNNGGPTLTYLPASNSPAVDSGDPNGCSDDLGNVLAYDQRGFPRVYSGNARCDIGAVEVWRPTNFAYLPAVRR
jgi:hypothetical protein